MSVQTRPPLVAAQHPSSAMATSSYFPLINSNLGYGQPYSPIVQMSPANHNHMNQLRSVPATVHNPCAGPPMVRCDWQTQQQLLQHQFLLQSGVSSNLLQPYVVSAMPLVIHQNVPASGMQSGLAVNAVYQPQLLQPELGKMAEWWRADSIPSNRSIWTAVLPVEAGPQITQKELQLVSVSERDDTVKSLVVPLHTATLPALPLHSHCKQSPQSHLCNSVTETAWTETAVMNAGDLAEVSSYSSSEADSMVRSVRNIIEQRTVKKTEVSSWLNDAVCQDDIWTKPDDAKDVWSCTRPDSRRNMCQMSSTEQDHTSIQASTVGSALAPDHGEHVVKRTANTNQGTISTVMSKQFLANAAETGFDDQQDIWPTSFGPFALQSDRSLDSLCRLPPGLETQVLSKYGVIGQRVSEMQKNASIEGSDSGVESVNSDCQGPVSICSSSELLLPSSSSSETAVASSEGARELQSSSSLQNPSATNDDSALTNTSLLVDVLSAVIAQITPHDGTISQAPCKSSSEAKSATVSASEDRSCVTSVSSQADVDSTQKQCESSSSQQSESVGQILNSDNTVRLADAITQLCDILSKPQLIRDLLNPADDRSLVHNEPAASTALNHSTETSCEMSPSLAVDNLPDQNNSASEVTVSGYEIVADRQDERSLVDKETYISLSTNEAGTCDDTFCRTLALNSSGRSDLQTLTKDDAFAVSCNNKECAADSQNDCGSIDSETDASFPVHAANKCNGNSSANQNISLTNSSQVLSEPVL